MKGGSSVVYLLLFILSTFTTYQVCDGECNSEEYTCDDGSCLNQEKVCDGYSDCEDHSDETSCESDPMVLTIGLTIGVLIILVLLCIFGCKAAIRERLATMASEHFTTGTQSHTTSPAIPLEDVSETQISCRSDIPPSYDAATTYPTYTGKSATSSNAVATNQEEENGHRDRSTTVPDTSRRLPPTYQQALMESLTDT